MDLKDRELLRLLSQDARSSWSKLAEQVHLSASACQRRVEALIKDKVINHFTVALNDRAVGNTVKAFISVNVTRGDTRQAERFRQQISLHPQVQSAHMISGPIDFMLEVVAEDIAGLSRFLEDDLLNMEGVRDATSSIVLRVIKPHSPVTEVA